MVSKDNIKENRVYWHWQNLNIKYESRGKTVTGSGIRYGRAWLYFYKWRFCVEWHFLSFTCHAQIEFGGEDSMLIGIAIPLISLWFHMATPKYRWANWRYPREIGFRIFDWAVWGSIWGCDMDSSANPHSWQEWSFHPLRFLFGRKKYSEEELETVETVAPLPEGDRPIKVKMVRATWRRTRLPFKTRMIMATVTPVDRRGIYIPGKGTASYNCGDDAVFSSTFQAKSVDEAALEFAKSILQTRKKYGGTYAGKEYKPQRGGDSDDEGPSKAQSSAGAS